MEQTIYSNLEPQSYNQPYRQTYKSPTSETYNFSIRPTIVFENFISNYKHSLNEPFIIKNYKKIKKQNKKIAAMIISSIGLIIELSLLYYIQEFTYIYKYCYWMFRINFYIKDVDQTLKLANNYSSTNYFYNDLLCSNNSNPYPECPDLCNFAYNLSYLQSSYYVDTIHFAEVVMGVLFMIYVLSILSKRLKMRKILVACFGIASMSMVLASLLYAGYRIGVFDMIDVDEMENDDLGMVDGPHGIKLAHGGKSLIGLLGFMISYRLALIFLAK